MTEGPPSRPSEQEKGGKSLWDDTGGEWRYFPGDKWYNPHWDYQSAPWSELGVAEHSNRRPPVAEVKSSQQDIRVELAADFRGEDVVLVAMTAAGVEALQQVLRNAVETAVVDAVLIAGDERFSIRVADAPTTVRRHDGALVWTLSQSKLEEITGKLDAIRAAPGPCHHYVDISEPVATLVLSRGSTSKSKRLRSTGATLALSLALTSALGSNAPFPLHSSPWLRPRPSAQASESKGRGSSGRR